MKDTQGKATSGMIKLVLTILITAILLAIGYLAYFLMPSAVPAAG